MQKLNESVPDKPLSLAAWYGEVSMLQILFTARTDNGRPQLEMQMLDDKYGRGGNAIYIAASRNNHECLNFVANVMRVGLSVKDSNGKIPWEVIGTKAWGSRKNAKQKKATNDWFVKAGFVESESAKQSLKQPLAGGEVVEIESGKQLPVAIGTPRQKVDL